ncbi:MAG: response regulator [Patescibacteria group bacterium]|nr:response regulator [Patescibacteria group bacterium]
MTKSPQEASILLVDDDPDYLEIVSTKLKQKNFNNITKAKNGKEALELIKNNIYDLVILDVMMPEKDGIDVALEIMSNEKFKNTRFLFLTAFGEDMYAAGKYIDQGIAKQLGALDFFRKQEPLDNFIHKVEDILGQN